jgi:hypothetical protein
MRIRIALGLLAALIACRQEPEEQPAPIPEAAGDWAVAAQADKTEIQVGEALTLDVTVRHPAGAEFLLATGENLAPFELVERVDEDSTNPMESRLRLRIAAYRLPGDITIPPLKVEYRDESGELASIETAPIPISLVTSLTPEVTDIHDIKDPVADIPVPGRWGRLWWLLAALLAAAMAYLLYRRFRKRQPELLAEPMPERLPPPEVEAEEALRKLVEARFLEMGKVREFYIALSEIMKRYAGRRFGVPYLERTTGEIQKDLRVAGIPQEGETKLDKILITSDLVKFARIVPPDEESNRMVPEGFRFIDQTKPRVVAPELVTPDGSVEAQP